MDGQDGVLARMDGQDGVQAADLPLVQAVVQRAALHQLLYDAHLNGAVQYSTLQNSTVQYSTAQHSTAFEETP
eukprot:1411993-Pyramimonas_sp.AAC.1